MQLRALSLTRYFQIFGSEKISTALPPKNFSKQLLFFKDTPLLIIPSQCDSNTVNLVAALNAIDAGVIWNGSSWPLQSLVTIISDTLPAAAISEKSIVLDVAPNDMGVVDMALLSHISSVVPDYFISFVTTFPSVSMYFKMYVSWTGFRLTGRVCSRTKCHYVWNAYGHL